MSFNAAKVAKSRIVMLSGDEDRLRQRSLVQLLEAVGVQRDDLDVEFRSADESTPAEWVGAASTVPFMAERRVVVVRHLLRREPDEQVKELKEVPESALLVLVVDDEMASTDDKARRLTTWRGKWEKAVKDAHGHVEVFKVDPKEAKDAVKREVAAMQKSMSDKAAEVLLEMCGGSLSRSYLELEKLALFVGRSEVIREADVREVVLPSREWNVFKLIDAVCTGAIPEALRQLRILIGSQPKAEDAAIGRIMPLMSRQLRLLWQARLCLDHGCAPDQPLPAVRALLPVKPNIVDEKPYRQASLIQLARRTDLRGLESCFGILAATDARLKGSLPSFSGLETMERMVLEMSEVLAPVRA